MSRLSKIFDIGLMTIGFLAGVAGAYGTVMFAARWFRGAALSRVDEHAWAVCTAAGAVGGGLALRAGLRLRRASGARSSHDGSIRLQRPGPQRRRSVHAARWATLVWLFVGAEVCFIFVRGGPATQIGHALIGAATAYFGVHAVVLLHELGHLTLAALLGLDLQKLQVGTGPVLLKGQFGGLQAEWRAWLGGGLVLTADERERGWRWRHWFYVAAGPAFTLGGCLALAWWIEGRHRGADWFRLRNNVADVMAMYLLGYSALLWLQCMVPTRARVGTVRAHSDGWQLLHTPRYDPQRIRDLIIVTCMRRVEMLWESGRRELAWTRLRTLLERYPTQALLSPAEGHFLSEQGDHAAAALRYERSLQTDGLSAPARVQLTEQRFSALVRADDPAAARRCCAEALRDVAPDHRAALLDALATGVLAHGFPAFLPEADAWSQEALALKPERITGKGTRGAVLVELGRYDEGAALLREVWAASASEVDAAISAFYLGVAARRQGDRREARRWLRRSKGFAPFVGKWLLERIAREETPASGVRL